MTRTFLYSLSAGLAVTLLVVLSDGIGLFASRENQTVDWRYRSDLRPVQPLSKQIALVGIDDSSLDRIGRWPWNRSTLADVVNELKRLGAKTIALDLILSEHQSYLDDYTGVRDQDERLADALTPAADDPQPAHCVLGVVLNEELLKDPLWLEPGAEGEWDCLLDALAMDIQNVAQAKKCLTGGRVELFEKQRLRFTKAAAWRVLRREHDRRFKADEEARFVEVIAPNRLANVDRPVDRKTLDAALEQSAAWDDLADHLLLPVNVRLSEFETQSPEVDRFRDRAPIALLAERASGIGFTNSRTRKQRIRLASADSRTASLAGVDPAVRELEVSLPAPGGFALQFGLSAAARHLDVEPANIEIDDDRIVFRVGGDPVEIPLREGQMRVHWPTSESDPKWKEIAVVPSAVTPADAPAGDAESGADAPFDAQAEAEKQGILPIRMLVEIVESRRANDVNRAKLVTITRGLIDRGAPGSGAPVPIFRGRVNIPAGRELDPEMLELMRAEVEKFKKTGDYEREDNRIRIDEWTRFDREVGLYPRRDNLEQEAMTRAFVTGKLVIVGWTATGALADFVSTPLDAKTPGFIVHASMANMALRAFEQAEHAYATTAKDWQKLSFIIAMALLCTLTAARLSVVHSVLVLFALVIGYEVAAVAAFASQDWIMPMVAPLVSGAGSWSVVTVKQAWGAQQDRARITRQFKARVSSQLVEKLVDDPHAISVSGDERVITVLFADMKGFTSISEGLEDKDLVVATLNRYMGEYTRALIAHDAYVNKFLGDGVMAFWSAFAPDPDQATKACRAALECQEATERVNQLPDLAEVPDISLRIGIATGKLVVGDCGAPPDLNDYTVIGDAANLAARLESANKKFDTQIIMNGMTKEFVEQRLSEVGGEAPGLFRAIGLIGVVGQKHETEVFNLLPAHASTEMIELTEKAVLAYRDGAFEDAKAAFDALEAKFGASLLIDNYRAAIHEVPAQPFRGVLRLHDK